MKNYNSFLLLFVFSLVGNTAVDYALLWESVSNPRGNINGSLLEAFFIAQSAGIIFLAPVLAIWIDRVSKLKAALTLDLAYAVILITVVLIYKTSALSILIVACFGFATAGIGMAHRAGIAGVIVSEAAAAEGPNGAIAKYNTALNYVALFGTIISGFIFRLGGFAYTIVFGVLTFLPIIVLYPKLFSNKTKQKYAPEPWAGVFQSFKTALNFYIKDIEIMRMTMIISILNIGSAIFPAIVAFAVAAKAPGRTDLNSVFIGLGIVFGTIALKPISKSIDNLRANIIIPLSVIPMLLTMIAGVLLKEPWFYVLGFVMGCIGSALRNSFSGVLRIARVPKAMIARVSTFNNSILQIGQIIGAFLLVPNLKTNLDGSVIFLIMAATLSGFFSYFLIGKQKVGQLKETFK